MTKRLSKAISTRAQKTRQLSEDHPQVMGGAAQYCVYRITERTIELAIRVHVNDGRLDRASPMDHRAQATRDPASQSRVIDPRAIDNDALTVYQQAAQIGVACLRNATQPRLANTAERIGRPTAPCCHLPAVSEVVPGTDRGEQRACRSGSSRGSIRRVARSQRSRVKTRAGRR